MENIDKKYSIKTKNSQKIIFMHGGILSFSTNKGKKKKLKIRKIVFYTNFIQMGNIKSTKKELRDMLKFDAFKAL